MKFDFTKIKNPVLDRRPDVFLRDPAIIYRDGIFRCFHTSVEENNENRCLYLEMSTSENLIDWQTKRLTTSSLNFSSPGNIIRVGRQWCMCVQSYPINHGEMWGNDDSRLWLMFSSDLENWSEPEVMVQSGCTCKWVTSSRQIDPYLVQYKNEYYCFYKAQNKLGLIKSPDMKNWEEVSPDRPVISHDDIPDHCAIENPCIIRDDNNRFVLFFSPCRQGRGIGVAYSDNLIEWKDFKYLDFPALRWAKNGPTAPAVIDMRQDTGYWIMFFHGDDEHIGHSAALGIAWSKNLLEWHLEIL